MDRSLKFRIKKVEGLYYLCSENKGADQLCGYREADCVFVFAYAKSRFSHNEAHNTLKISHSVYLGVNPYPEFWQVVYRRITDTLPKEPISGISVLPLCINVKVTLFVI